MFSIFKKKKVIVTHDGNFHPDEVFAIATILLAFPDEDFKIVRTRDKKEMIHADFVIDVGHRYDPQTNRFDHHQGNVGTRNNSIPYASFGLVWKEYGQKVAGKFANDIEQKLVVPIDAFDNGIELSSARSDGLREYRLADAFLAYKNTWKEPSEGSDERFHRTLVFAREILERTIMRMRDKEEGATRVLKEYAQVTDKRILVLDTFYPFTSAVGEMPELLFVIHPDMSGGNWCLEAVPPAEDSFESRILLPEAWAGKREAELEAVTGVPGSIFCHLGRFLMIAKTREAALTLAQKALNG